GAAPYGGGEGVGGHAERQHRNGERRHHREGGNSAGRMTARSTRGPAPRVQHAGLARRKNPLIAPCPEAGMLTRSRLGYVGSYSPAAAPLAPRSSSINPHMAPNGQRRHDAPSVLDAAASTFAAGHPPLSI